jgi:hypothetical protein
LPGKQKSGGQQFAAFREFFADVKKGGGVS